MVMSVPASLNFDIASHVLRKVWAKIVERERDYDASRRAVLVFERPENEVSLRTVLGLKPPSNATGVTARFVNTFFARMNEAQRQAYFREGAPAGFDVFMREIQGNSEFRLQITKKDSNLLMLELTARKSKDDNPDLYHLSIFSDPVALNDRRLHYNVHVTQEVPQALKGTEQRTYYRFDNVFGPVLRHDNKPPGSGLNPAAAEWRPQQPGKYVPPHRRGGKTKKRSRKQKKTRRRRLQRKTL
jgi:hypothetical protein